MRKYFFNIMLLFPAMAYLALSLTLNEEHPFSRFAMYSSFPETADYYYFALDDGTPVSGLKAGVTSLAQLKDIIVRRIDQDNLPYDSVSLSTVGAIVLDSICPTIQMSGMAQGHAAVFLMYHNMRLSSGGRLEHEEFILATCHVN